MGKRSIAAPSEFVRDEQSRERYRACVRQVLDDIVIDLNAEVNELGEDFDYRGRLREEDWVKDLGRRLVADHQRQVRRKRIPSFEEDWESKG